MGGTVSSGQYCRQQAITTVIPCLNINGKITSNILSEENVFLRKEGNKEKITEHNFK